MAVPYAPTNQPGNKYSVPDYAEAADGPAAFKTFADSFKFMLPPIGSLMPYAGTSAPQGWLLCDGSEYDQTTYPQLSTICGVKFGTAAAGNFKVPDLRGRVIAGLNTSDTDFSTVGKTGGAKNVTIQSGNLPQHSHTASGSGTVTVANANATHTHTGTTGSDTHSHLTKYRSVDRQSGSGGTSVPINEGADSDTTTDDTHSHSFTTGSADATHTHGASVSLTVSVANGGGVAAPTALPIVQPYLTLNYLIRADI